MRPCVGTTALQAAQKRATQRKACGANQRARGHVRSRRVFNRRVRRVRGTPQRAPSARTSGGPPPATPTDKVSIPSRRCRSREAFCLVLGAFFICGLFDEGEQPGKPPAQRISTQLMRSPRIVVKVLREMNRCAHSFTLAKYTSQIQIYFYTSQNIVKQGGGCGLRSRSTS